MLLKTLWEPESKSLAWAFTPISRWFLLVLVSCTPIFSLVGRAWAYNVPPVLPVPPMPLDAWATGYFTTSSLGTLLTTECRAIYTNDLYLQSKKKGGGQWSDQPVRLVLRNSFTSSPLIYFRTPPHGLSSSNFLFLPTPPFVFFHVPSPVLSTGIFSPIFYSYTLSLLMRSSCLLLRTQLLRLLLPSFLLFKIINSQPCHNQSPPLLTPIGPLFRRRLLRIVLRFFGCCPRAGLFAATTLCRFWNSVATNAWLGLKDSCWCVDCIELNSSHPRICDRLRPAEKKGCPQENGL